MEIKRIPAGIYAANCYILTDLNNKISIVLDPGGDAPDLIRYIDSIGTKVSAILLTHGHADHTGAAAELQQKYAVQIYVNEEDYYMMASHEYMYGYDLVEKVNKEKFHFLNNEEIINFGDLSLKCIFTPGHTKGGVSFLAGNDLFTGDTLFLNSIGRTDFEGGDYEEIIASIKMQLLPLGDDKVVYPGHGPKTSIKNEKLNNPFL